MILHLKLWKKGEEGKNTLSTYKFVAMLFFRVAAKKGREREKERIETGRQQLLQPFFLSTQVFFQLFFARGYFSLVRRNRTYSVVVFFFSLSNCHLQSSSKKSSLKLNGTKQKRRGGSESTHTLSPQASFSANLCTNNKRFVLLNTFISSEYRKHWEGEVVGRHFFCPVGLSVYASCVRPSLRPSRHCCRRQWTKPEALHLFWSHYFLG